MHPLRAALITLLLILFSSTLGQSQRAQEWSGFYPESYAREVAITTVMPIFPLDAVQRGITGVVQVKIAIDDQGEVVKLKIRPGIDPALKQAVADAVSKWTFRLQPEVLIPGRNSLSRLTFKFSINGAEPQVELYDPGPSAKDRERLGYWNGATEIREWNNWEEVQPKKPN
jgi:TonB family protein